MEFFDDLGNWFQGLLSPGDTPPSPHDVPQAPEPQQNPNTILGMDKDTAGLVGMGLLSSVGLGHMLLPVFMKQLMGDEKTAQPSTIDSDPVPNYLLKQSQDMDVPDYLRRPTTLPQDKQQLLTSLKEQAAIAYPDNPTLQQVAITQAIHESGLMGAHPSSLAMKYNNYFGIKAPGTGGTVNMRTNEYLNGSNQMVNAGFGRNNSIADSFMQHRNLLTKNKRYGSVLSAQNPADAFRALQNSGYATDPSYANKLNHVYASYVAPLY